MTFASENGAKVAVKTEKELIQELNTYSDKLLELLSSGLITEKQYDSYDQILEYIYIYYISYSKGEQIPYRKMTNDEYERIEQEALENGVNLLEQQCLENKNIRYNFDQIQELQNQVKNR